MIYKKMNNHRKNDTGSGNQLNINRLTIGLLVGCGSGMLYGSIVFQDCLQFDSTQSEIFKAVLTQFIASFSKTFLSFVFITFTLEKAKSVLMKIVAAYWQIPLTLAIYYALHLRSGTPETQSKIIKIAIVMSLYYTALFIFHLMQNRSKSLN